MTPYPPLVNDVVGGAMYEHYKGSQYLVLGAKARAAMDGRGIPDLDDVNAMALPVLAHRIVVNFQAEAEGVTPEQLIELPRRP